MWQVIDWTLHIGFSVLIIAYIITWLKTRKEQ